VTRKQVPTEALLQLRQRLMRLPPRSGERRVIMQETAALYGVAEVTLYRLLRERMRPRALRRADCGSPRVLTKAELEHYCELVAAIKLRTSNRKGRHLSTTQALRLLEDYGITVDNRLLQAPKGVLNKSTVNRYLKQWGLDRGTLMRQPPAVRFQARYSNQCWQFDLSPSDMKQLPAPPWIDASRGALQLMLYSVVDDRSGVAYQEYHCVYGEDVEAALRHILWNDDCFKEAPLSYTYTAATERLANCDCVILFLKSYSFVAQHRTQSSRKTPLTDRAIPVMLHCNKVFW
jgi:hypothetical protein